MGDEIDVKQLKAGFLKLVKNKKIQLIVTLLLFLVILVSSTHIRLQNVENLKDTTTDEYLTNDLDSLYFYRVAETKINLGKLPEIDELRSPGYEVESIPELIDDYLVINYRILKIFNPDITFNYAATISAPIFYVIGLILFFILSLLLTKSKIASLIASAFLAYAPGFLFRSIAGFYDHDHVGVFALFAFSIILFFGLVRFEKSYKESAIWGILIGFFSALVLVSWGGAITFVLVFLPVTLFIYWQLFFL
jgi:asparagine N-glycosylation enzyme membrane subunit Stt3